MTCITFFCIQNHGTVIKIVHLC